MVILQIQAVDADYLHQILYAVAEELTDLAAAEQLLHVMVTLAVAEVQKNAIVLALQLEIRVAAADNLHQVLADAHLFLQMKDKNATSTHVA